MPNSILVPIVGLLSTVLAASPAAASFTSAERPAAHYDARPSEFGFEAANPAQGFRAAFDGRGLHLESNTTRASIALFDFRMVSLGRGDAVAPVSAGRVGAEGNRITIERDGSTEWFENAPFGLEHGVTLSERPSGRGPLVVAFEISGARAVARDTGIEIRTESGRRLDYNGLTVFDATAREVEASLASPRAGRIEIHVDDTTAVYPLTIDPTFSQGANFTSANLPGFSWSLSDSVDLNGDGLKDLVVGHPGDDFVASDAGAILVFHGDVNGLPSPMSELNADAILRGAATDRRFGHAVASAGDVNGDGYEDLIVGEPRSYDSVALPTESGVAYVFFGGPASLPLTGDAATEADITLNPPPSIEVDGCLRTITADSYGYAVGGAGDLDGDGFDDVIVGAPYSALTCGAGAAEEYGFATVHYGDASGTMTTSAPSVLAGGLESAYGSRVTGVGDLGADGFDDVAVGSGGVSSFTSVEIHPSDASGVLPATFSYAATASLFPIVSKGGDLNGDGYGDLVMGSAFDLVVFEGGPGGLVGIGQTEADADTRITNALSASDFPVQLTSGSDFDGDGMTDVVGISGASVPCCTTDIGFLQFHGRDGGIPSGDTSLALPPVALGASANVEFRADGGDTNGDSIADLALGAGNAGGAVFPGRSARPFPPGVAFAAGRIESDQIGAELGGVVSSAGDINGDGLDDILVSATRWSDVGVNDGVVFVFLGTTEGFGELDPADAHARIVSNQAGASLGISLASGDVNGDGYADVFVGATGIDLGETNEGAVLGFYGSQTGFDAVESPTTADAVIEGGATNLFFGGVMANAGDLNGDGYVDLAVAASSYSAGESGEGAVFVFHGGGNGISATQPADADSIIEGDAALTGFGASVDGAGDVNGDGFGDLVVGASVHSNPEMFEGGAWVFEGSAAGIVATSRLQADAALESDQVQALFGAAVAGAGDVNGDGFDDVVVGATLYDSDEVNEGSVFAYYGGPSGIASGGPAVADLVFDLDTNPGDDQSNAWFGTRIAAAGDSNGDGYSDLIVSAPLWDFATSVQDAGRVNVVFGSSSGLVPPTALTTFFGEGIYGDVIDRELSSWVASAGDLNGDGYADQLLGCIECSYGESAEGAAFVFPGNPGDWGVQKGPNLELRQGPIGGGDPVAPLGFSRSGDGFSVEIHARHPDGRGKLKFEAEACPPGVAWGAPACSTEITPTWADSGPGGITLRNDFTGLADGELYRWRARLLRAKHSITQPGIVEPLHPEHGRWLRHRGLTPHGDIRVPEPGFSTGLLAGLLALATLRRSQHDRQNAR